MIDNIVYEKILKKILEKNNKSATSNEKEVTNQNIHAGTKKEADKIDDFTQQSQDDDLKPQETTKEEQTNISKTDRDNQKSTLKDQTSEKDLEKNGLSSLKQQSLNLREKN